MPIEFGQEIGSSKREYKRSVNGLETMVSVYHPLVELNRKMSLLADSLADQTTESGLAEFESEAKACEFAKKFLDEKRAKFNN